MNAWPMIARCQLAQWHGLEEHIRQCWESVWRLDMDPGVLSDMFKPGGVVQRTYVLWEVEASHLYGARRYLISVKEDAY